MAGFIPQFVMFVALLLPQVIRFAWLSDTHVGSDSGALDLRAVVEDVNRQEGLAFVVLSGDITEYGATSQLELAKSILDQLKMPYYIIPGNHDTKWSESGCMAFLQLWGSDHFSFDAGGIRFIGMHQGPRMRMADGHFAPEDVRWLDSALATAGHTTPVIFITHYPIDSSISNWYVVLDRLKRCDTRVVLVGHGHADRVEDYEGIRGIMGRSTLHTRSVPAGYNIVSVRSDSIVITSRRTDEDRSRQWAALANRRSDSTTFVSMPARPDFSINSLYPRIHEEWAFRTAASIGSSPAVSDGIAIIGDASGCVYGMDIATGKECWKRETGGPVYSTPACAEGRAVFGSADGGIYCLDTRTGKLFWRVSTRAAVLGSPAIVDDRVYVGGSDRVFRALDLASGRQVWGFDSLQGFVETKPLVTSEHVFFGAWDQCFYALDRHTGSLSWRWTGETKGALYSPAACWPVDLGARVAIVAPDRKTTLLDAKTGNVFFRTGRYQVRESIGRSLDGKGFYVRTMRDSLVALSITDSTFHPLWETHVGFGYDINAAMPVESNGLVFYGTQHGFLYALDAKSGHLRWAHRVSAVPLNTIVPLDAHALLTADFDGCLKMITFEPEAHDSRGRTGD